VICTRNRPEPLAKVVGSLLAGERAPFELLVIDQSDEPLAERAQQLLPRDERLRHVRSSERGKGKALNQALGLARGSILVCTDDDCQAPPGWISGMARALESQPQAVMAFCRVLPVPHDRTAGYVPAYELRQSRTLRSISDMCGGLGIGAGVALRSDFVRSIGGFDEAFGPGGRFPSADEWDLAIRSLLSGRHVFETAELEIVHDGFRTFEQGRAHARRDWLALGAVCAKPLRAGHWKAAVVPVWLFSTQAVWPPLADALALRKPRGVGRIVAFVQGFAQGLLQRVEAETLRFR
jgi:glycosyltransferase involved in cell wall biosynthesis